MKTEIEFVELNCIHVICPKCGNNFDIDPPKGTITPNTSPTARPLPAIEAVEGKREIKFRAWDNKLKMWHVWGIDVNDFGAFFTSPPHSNLTHCQYTGLKDKNGKEIYEGDILNFKFDGVYFIKNRYYVVFENGAFLIHKPNFHNLVSDCDWTVVVGNIYENPELLNSDKEDKRSVARDGESSKIKQ